MFYRTDELRHSEENMNKKLLLILIPIVLIVSIVLFLVLQKKPLPDSSYTFSDGGTYDYLNYDDINDYYETYKTDMLAEDPEFWDRNTAYDMSIRKIIEFSTACKFDVAPIVSEDKHLTFVLNPSSTTEKFINAYNRYITPTYIKDYNQAKEKSYAFDSMDLETIKNNSDEVCDFLHFIDVHYPSASFYLNDYLR